MFPVCPEDADAVSAALMKFGTFICLDVSLFAGSNCGILPRSGMSGKMGSPPFASSFGLRGGLQSIPVETPGGGPGGGGGGAPARLISAIFLRIHSTSD